MTTTSDPYTDQDRRAAEWYGFRPSQARPCPRVVAGRRCTGHRHNEPCICVRRYWTLDHARIWLDDDGHHVLTAEPYQTSGGDLAEVLADLDELGLTVTVTGRSLWNPGATYMLILENREGRTW